METYAAPQGYDDTADHLANFFQAVESREHVVEDEVFGNNAAIACHMANHSYFHKNVATWDAAAQTIKGRRTSGESMNEKFFSQNFFESRRRAWRCGVCGRAIFAGRVRHVPVGLQLYSVRDLLPKNFEGTLHQLARSAYKEVEAAGYFDKTAADFRHALDKAGLRLREHASRAAGAEGPNSTS